MRHRTLALLMLALAAAMGGCSWPPAPTQTASPIAPTPTPISGPAMCDVDQLGLGAGRPEGAAGTTYIPIQVVLQGGETCRIFRWPNARIVDAAGNELIVAQPSTRLAETVELGERFTFNLGWSSWCGELPRRPYSLEVGLSLRGTSTLELPDAYEPSGCLGPESTLTFEPAS